MPIAVYQLLEGNQHALDGNAKLKAGECATAGERAIGIAGEEALLRQPAYTPVVGRAEGHVRECAVGYREGEGMLCLIGGRRFPVRSRGAGGGAAHEETSEKQQSRRA